MKGIICQRTLQDTKSSYLTWVGKFGSINSTNPLDNDMIQCESLQFPKSMGLLTPPLRSKLNISKMPKRVSELNFKFYCTN